MLHLLLLFLCLHIIYYILVKAFVFNLLHLLSNLLLLYLVSKSFHVHIFSSQFFPHFLSFLSQFLLFLFSHSLQIVLFINHCLFIPVITMVVWKYFILEFRLPLVLMQPIKVLFPSLFYLLYLIFFHCSKIPVILLQLLPLHLLNLLLHLEVMLVLVLKGHFIHSLLKRHLLLLFLHFKDSIPLHLRIVPLFFSQFLFMPSFIS